MKTLKKDENIDLRESIRRIYYCKLSDRYESMLKEVMNAIEICKDENIKIDLELRNAFGLSFQNLINPLRKSWKILTHEKGIFRLKNSKVPNGCDSNDGSIGGNLSNLSLNTNNSNKSGNVPNLNNMNHSNDNINKGYLKNNLSSESLKGGSNFSNKMSEFDVKKKDTQNKNGEHFDRFDDLNIIDEYLRSITKELLSLCGKAHDFMAKNIKIDLNIKKEKEGLDAIENNVYFLKMKGDHFRYKAEILKGKSLKIARDEATKCYRDAKLIADSQLKVTNSTRLGLYLNISVFNYEIVHNTDEALKIAEKAFDLALEELDEISEENYNDSTIIMQLLRDNLTLWTTQSKEKRFIGDNDK